MTVNPKDESAKAITDAQKHLEDARSMRTVAASLARSLKMQRQHNHFGEMIRDSMRPRGDGHDE